MAMANITPLRLQSLAMSKRYIMQLMSQSLNRSGLTRVSSRIHMTRVHHKPTLHKTIATLDSRFLILDRLLTIHDSMLSSQPRSVQLPAPLLHSIKPAGATSHRILRPQLIAVGLELLFDACPSCTRQGKNNPMITMMPMETKTREQTKGSFPYAPDDAMKFTTNHLFHLRSTMTGGNFRLLLNFERTSPDLWPHVLICCRDEQSSRSLQHRYTLMSEIWDGVGGKYFSVLSCLVFCCLTFCQRGALDSTIYEQEIPAFRT
jgi:hypothetical protein